MPGNNTEIERRLWEAADELRAVKITTGYQRSPEGSASNVTVPPRADSFPKRISSESGRFTDSVITRASGRAPSSGSKPALPCRTWQPRQSSFADELHSSVAAQGLPH